MVMRPKVFPLVWACMFFDLTASERMSLEDLHLEDDEDQFLTEVPHNKCGWAEQSLMETNVSKAHECSDLEWNEFVVKFDIHSVKQKSVSTNKKVCKQNNVVWFYPAEDHNGAFDINANVCYRLMGWAKRACAVHFYRVNGPVEANQILRQFPTRSIRHMVLGGHGTGQTLGWGKGAGFIGVTMKVGTNPTVPMGATVQWNRGLLRDDRKPGGYVIPPKTEGLVMQADLYRSLVVFDGIMDKPLALPVKEFTDVQIKYVLTARLMQDMSFAMQTHGSIFLDSCLSATPKVDVNLADYVAHAVGQGVRVIGSEVSFGHVDVTRFDGWWTEIHTDQMKNAQRVFIRGAYCPSWAEAKDVDKNGNCHCEHTEVCVTASGKQCRAAQGRMSSKEFLPSCAETWMEDQCMCKPKLVPRPNPKPIFDPFPVPNPTPAPAPQPIRPTLCPAWAQYKYADKFGNCQCPGTKICRTRYGQACSRKPGYTSSGQFHPYCADCSCVDKKPQIRQVEGKKLGCTVDSGFGRTFTANEDGNCVCQPGYICRTRANKRCPFFGIDSSGERAHRASCSIMNNLERDYCLCSKK